MVEINIDLSALQSGSVNTVMVTLKAADGSVVGEIPVRINLAIGE